jgi:hypothetical protein
MCGIAIIFAIAVSVAISLLVLFKRAQRDELHSRVNKLQESIALQQETNTKYDIRIDKLKKDMEERAVAILSVLKPGAIETVSLGGHVITRPRRAHPSQITPIHMAIPRPLQPIRGGVSPGIPGDAVLVEETNGRRAP